MNDRLSVRVFCALLVLVSVAGFSLAADGKASVPSDKQLANTIFENIEAESFQLKKGRFTGEPYSEKGPERLEVELLKDRTIRGDLNEDGVDDAAVILSATTGSERRRFWLSAVTGRYGHPASFGSLLLGERMEVIEGKIEGGQIKLKIAEFVLLDTECPAQIWSKHWAVMDGVLTPSASFVAGRRECAPED